MCRDDWTSLDGIWQFAHDDDGAGSPTGGSTPSAEAFDQRIEVPFPPESPASGVGDAASTRWSGTAGPLTARRRCRRGARPSRVLVHFGAVDHRAHVWFDGQLVAEHVGGQTPFTVDVTEAARVTTRDAEHVLVVRAEDDPHALHQPRGKQDWREKPHGIWYERTTGIWQSVWLETVPAHHVVDVAWTPHLSTSVVTGGADPGDAPGRAAAARRSTLTPRARRCWRRSPAVAAPQVTELDVAVPALRNGQDRARLLWSPEDPAPRRRARSCSATGGRGAGRRASPATSGLREVAVGGGSFTAERPALLHAVGARTRATGRRRTSPPEARDELRTEVELIKAMGFNAVRVHQKAEDPRFLLLGGPARSAGVG